MTKTVLVTIVLGLLSAAIATVLFVRLHDKNQEVQLVENAEKEIRQKFSVLRDIEVAHFKKYNRYVSTYDSLKSFVNDDLFYLVERKEEVITLYYGADSIAVSYDTIGTVSVRDSVFSGRKKTKGYTLDNLGTAPVTNLPFEFFAGTVGNKKVFEIIDPKPVNPKRNPSGLPALQVGSRYSSTTKGNWEK